MRLLDAELDGDRLTREEVLLNCLNLAIGGNETTKNATAAGLAAFAAHPEQWQWLRRHPEHVDRAIEEVLRWTTPPLHLTRTVLRPTRLGGTSLEPGELVCLWLPSANRDQEVFPDPDEFRVDRAVNPHLSFTSGRHFCLGAALARSQLRLVLEALLARVDTITLLGEAGPAGLQLRGRLRHPAGGPGGGRLAPCPARFTLSRRSVRALAAPGEGPSRSATRGLRPARREHALNDATGQPLPGTAPAGVTRGRARGRRRTARSTPAGPRPRG